MNSFSWLSLVLSVCFGSLLIVSQAESVRADELTEAVAIFQSFVYRAEQAAGEAARASQLAQSALTSRNEVAAVRLFAEADRALEEAARNRGLAQQALANVSRINPAVGRGLQSAFSSMRQLIERIAWGIGTVLQGIARATGLGATMRSFLSSFAGRGLSAALGVVFAVMLPLTIADAVLGFGAGTAYAAEPGPCHQSFSDCVDRTTCELFTTGPTRLMMLSSSCQQSDPRSEYYSLLSRVLDTVDLVRRSALASSVQCQAAIESVYQSARGAQSQHLISCGVTDQSGNACLLMASREACHACCNGDNNNSSACWGDCDVWYEYERCYEAATNAVAASASLSLSPALCPSENRFLNENIIPGLSPIPEPPGVNSGPRAACELQVSLLFGQGPYSPDDQRNYSSCVELCEENVPQECVNWKEAATKRMKKIEVVPIDPQTLPGYPGPSSGLGGGVVGD